MRLALDARTIYRPTRRGTGKNLLDLYRQVTALRPDWRVLAYHRDRQAAADLLPAAQVQPRHIEMIGDRLAAWERWRLPLAARADDADVLHCPANTCPTWMPVPTLVTIHDLIPLDGVDDLPAAQVRHFANSVRHACHGAAHIVCPSAYTRDRLVCEFDADPTRITVNAWAPDASVRPVEPEHWPAVLARYGVRRPFVLHFGAGGGRKNTRRLIEAWSLVSESLRRPWQLLVVGLDEAAKSSLMELAVRHGIGAGLQLNGFADEADLPALLSAADLLAYPSLSEGFGLPILDAWVTGAAVLAANATSIPEVAGDAALLVDPMDVNDLATGLTCLMENEPLRLELARRGRRRLEQYSWRATAERFIQAVETAASAGGTLRMAA